MIGKGSHIPFLAYMLIALARSLAEPTPRPTTTFPVLTLASTPPEMPAPKAASSPTPTATAMPTTPKTQAPPTARYSGATAPPTAPASSS